MDKIEYTLNKIYNYKNNIKFKMEYFSNSQFRKVLKQNNIFNKTYNEKRCFILGNGPSLKKEQLNLLENEYVFTVNQFPKSDLYKKVKSNFHIIVDPIFFNFEENNEPNLERLQTFKKINNNNNNPICIFPYIEKCKIDKFGLNEILNCNYIYCNKIITEGYNEEFDMCKNMPHANTVVQYAIYVAVYMGFKEIYLLGCDMTDFILHFTNDNRFSDEKNTHVYEYTENDKRSIEKLSSQSKEKILYNYYKVYQNYRIIKHYCEKRDIKITNLTKNSILDVYEKNDFKSLLSQKTN